MIGTQFDLKGRVAIVTRGSKGLGKAMARGFAVAGAECAHGSRRCFDKRLATDALAPPIAGIRIAAKRRSSD